MSERNDESVPAGFVPLPRGLGFSDNLQPIYRRREGDKVALGLIVAPQHGNSLGICHGGVLMTLADIAAATGVNLACGIRSGTPTVNLAVDFINAARMGQWIQANIDLVTVKRRFGFCSGTIANSKEVVARFNGTFYLPDHPGMLKEDALGDGVPGTVVD